MDSWTRNRLADVQREGAARRHPKADGCGCGLDPAEPAAARRWDQVARRAAQLLLALRAAHNDRRRRTHILFR